MATKNVGKLGVTVSASGKQLSAEMGRIEREVAQTKKDIEGVGGAAAGAVPGVGNLLSTFQSFGPAAATGIVAIAAIKAEIDLIAAAARFVAGEIVSAFDRIGKLADEADALGISAQSLAGLQFAGQLAGVNDFTKLLTKLQQKIGEAATEGGKAEKTFNLLGLSGQELAAMPLDDAMFTVADALAAYGNQAERSALNVDIFGKAGGKALGIISQGSAALKEAQRDAELFGVALSDVDVAQMDAAGDKIAAVQAVMKGAANVAADELAPALADLAERFLGIARSGEGSQQFLRDYFDALKKDIAFVIDSKTTLGGEFLTWLEGAEEKSRAAAMAQQELAKGTA
ncbi:MAG: hypothetical protein L0Z53_19275, partial [Acidobacteriales bacterium]|nr:hypothetical protein [Terriglobales bacterium]